MLANRKINNKPLFIGAIFSLSAALAHLAVIAGGPDWYRAFGAGEQMARLAEAGSWYPVNVTLFIAAILFIWALYGFAAAGLLRRLPFMRLALVLISAIYLLRGLLGVPVVMLAEGPHINELQQNLTFMLVSSFICLLIGVCYAIGTAQVWSTLTRK